MPKSNKKEPGSQASRPSTAGTEAKSLQQLTHGDIACRAYELYLHRAGAPGYELEDWLQAEKDLGNR